MAEPQITTLDKVISGLLLGACLATLAVPPAGRPPLTGPQQAPELEPPRPPVIETFQGEPQISLFPRLGDFRPEEGDDRLPFWRTYRDHLLKISGVVKTDPLTGNLAFTFRGIRGIDSIGHFMPLAVEPNSRYRIRYKLRAELPEGAGTGLGLLEYREFLWVGEQYPQTLHDQVYLAAHELLRTRGTGDWQEVDLEFTTGPQTGMIHLVFFREGVIEEREGVMIDNVSVVKE